MTAQTTPQPDDKLATLALFDSEVQATLVANELNNAGIDAQASGTLTAGFRAEAPGSVQVLVHAADLERAREVYADYLTSKQAIDWDNVDVGEMEDGAMP